jgi:hypothetical protein
MMTRDQIIAKYSPSGTVRDGHYSTLALAARGFDSAWGRPVLQLEVDKASRLIDRFFTNATVTDGVPRWNSSDQIPPRDIIALWDSQDLPFDYEATLAAYEADLAASLAAYRANPPQLSEETLAEMRAEFGPGEVVVDVITGVRTQL